MSGHTRTRLPGDPFGTIEDGLYADGGHSSYRIRWAVEADAVERVWRVGPKSGQIKVRWGKNWS